MENTIFIQLLGEGTAVYRPVTAKKIESNVFIVGGDDVYDPDDENWEFPPGSVVIVQEKELEGEKVLVAIHERS